MPGAAVAVWQDGDFVAERYAGEASAGVAVDESTLFALASVTKPVVAAAMMALVDEGSAGLDNAVIDIVPEFGQPDAIPTEHDKWRPSVTIRQLMSHTSGLPEDLPRKWFADQPAPRFEVIADALIARPLEYQPGTQMVYSNAGFALLGRVIERTSGANIWDLVWERVLDPLQLRNTVDRPGPSLDHRIARVRDPGNEGRETESYNSQYWRDLGIPWGGLYGSARDLATFAAPFLASGSSFLSTTSSDAMTSDQIKGLSGTVQSLRVHWPQASWGLGWEVKGDKRKHWTGELTSPATFCHFGAAGTMLWADPQHQIAAAIFANRTTFHLWPFRPPRWSRLSNSIVSALT